MVVWWQALVWVGLVYQVATFSVESVLSACERRPTALLVRLRDPVLAVLPRRDLTGPINVLQHLCHALYLRFAVHLLYDHDTAKPLGTVSLAIVLLLMVRNLCLWVTPLEVPEGHIHLQDNISDTLLRRPASHRTFDRDLFFSGHVSLLCLAAWTCAAWSPAYSWAFGLAAVAQAINLLLSRVHYTVDVVMAPFVSYGCWHLAQLCWWD